MCVSLIWCCLSQYSSIIMPKASQKSKHKGESRQRYREVTVRIANAYRCRRFAPGRFSLRREHLAAFPTARVPGLQRQRGDCGHGVCRWIWQREWRRASPYLLPHPPDPAPPLRDRKPAPRFLPPERGLDTPPLFLRGGRCGDCR